MFKQLRFAAVPLMAGATIALTTTSVWAFSQQIVQPNGNYNFNYGPLDNKLKSDDGKNISDPNSLGLHFSIHGDQTAPSGSRSFGGDGTSPDYYARPLGNGN